MSLIQDSDTAAECLDHLQTMLWESGDHSQDDDISSLICMLQSPLFRQLLVLQDSIQELDQVNASHSVKPNEFDFLPELQLDLSSSLAFVNTAFSESTPSLSQEEPSQAAVHTPAYDAEFQKTIDKAAMGREVEKIKLYKAENQSLGFSVVQVSNPAESGIFVQDLQPGGIAERHGRLRERDQILAIDGQPLDLSHSEAIRILLNTRGPVELIVARGPVPAGEDQLAVGETSEQAQQQQAGEPSDMVLNTEWTQIEVIDLINDGTGLGFGIIGGRSTGVVVKTILPGGVADNDGRLRSGDHILEIGDVNVRGMGSEQVAAVLRQSGSAVRLIVARPVNEPSSYPTPHAPIIPTHQLDRHLKEINSLMEKQEQDKMLEIQREQDQQQMLNNMANQAPQSLLPANLEQVQIHPPPYDDVPTEYPEVEYFDVQLLKDTQQGLGITIAGYVGRDNTPDDLCGIFVKSITEGSAAAMDGRIQVNDQIIEVDGHPLQGFSNHDAVEVLRKTGQVVNLKLARYQHGAKFEKLQQYLGLAQPSLMNGGPPVLSSKFSQPVSMATPIYDLGMQQQQQQQISPTSPPPPLDANDIALYPQSNDMDGEISPDVEVAIKACWEPIIGEEFEVVVAQLSKFREGGGLGISLEGTVDVEDGVEVRPHHYIRAILPDGPVGLNGRLISGDELLEVNGKRLLGLNHKEVVGILKELPQNVRLVCARRKHTANEIYAQQTNQFMTSPLNTGVSETALSERLVKAKSEMALSAEPYAQTNLLNKKSRSLEPLTGLAMWSSEAVVIELKKGDKGLGFSILDYQDPVNPSETVIVIRSLVPGGVAQLDGRLVPGDRLIFVNDVNLENATLDEAVQALKGAQKGVVKLGVAKPLPFSGAFQDQAIPGPQVQPQQQQPQMVLSSTSQPPQFAAPPVPHEHVTDGPSVPTVDVSQSALTRKESSSSASTTSDLDTLPKRAHRKTKDSFYESDEDLSFVSPSKSTPKKAVRPVAAPRKQDSMASATSYENEEAITTFHLAEQAAKEKEMEAARERETMMKEVLQLQQELDYENANMSLTESKFTDDDQQMLASPRADSPEPLDYENATLGPLPTYEEAVSGEGAEFFNMDDMEGPPVPQREDSNQLTVSSPSSQEPGGSTLSDLSSEELTILPSQRESSEAPEMVPVGVKKPRPKPPIPPKPLSPYAGKPTWGKEEPPPLPDTSPPPVLSRTESAKSPSLSAIVPGPEPPGKAGSMESSVSADHFTSSDLKVVTSPSCTPRTASPGMSPIASPSLLRSFSGPDSLPPTLEKRITLKKSHDHLGLTVEAAEKGVNGCVVKNLTKTGAIAKDGNIQSGDYITSVNNESMRRVTNAQARAILRRASLIGSTDISICYITADDAAIHREALAKRPPESPSTPTMMPSPNSTLSPMSPRPRTTSEGSSHSSPSSSPAKPRSPVANMSASDTPPSQTSLRQKAGMVEGVAGSPTPVASLGNQTWGPPRLVELERETGKTLGISIVGGRVDMFHVSQDHVISGIFIKHVLEDSPAGRNGTLKTGDRILQVDGKDLRYATHDQAVEIIRHASTPVKFVVQSLGDPTCPRDLETDTKSVHSYDEAQLQAQPVVVATQSQVLQAPLSSSPPVAESSPEPPPEDEVDEYGYSTERIQRRYGELKGDLLLVGLSRGDKGLGISLAGNKDRNTMSVFVAGIQPDSSAASDGRIQVGDELLEVNGNTLYGRSHLNASAIIKGLKTDVVKLVLLRRDDYLDRMAIKPLKMPSPIGQRQEKANNISPPPAPEPATLNPVPTEEKPPVSPTSTLQDVVQIINLQKGPSGLGFAIVEETREDRLGIYVRSITFGGVADKDAQLSIGDQILEVQDKSLTGVHYDKAIEVLRNSQGSVRLKVRKCGAATSPGGQQLSPHGLVQLANPPGESSTDVADSGPNAATTDEGSGDPLTRPIIPGQETTIEIEKGRTGLGLSIVGGADTLLGAIIIHEVYEDGAAARDGRLWAGDQILEVNHENLRDATHDYAIQVLRQTPSNVTVLVFRDDSHVKEEDIYDIFTVELIKKPGKGLGLSIVGKRNDVGVYISDIVKGGASEADGRLMQGDQILAVNGEDMRNATQEYAAAVLKTLMGKVTLMVGRLKAGSRTSSRRNSNSPGNALRKSESTASNKSKGGRHSKKGSEDMSHIRTVELKHDASGSLGLSIAGGIGSSLGDAPVMVANMTPNGPAERSHKLKIGDKMLSINGVSTEGMLHDQVVRMLKSSEDSITLQVTQGEQTPVSVSGRSSVTRQMSTEAPPEIKTPTTQENNVFEGDDDGPPPQCKTIVLERGPDGLGFSIVGGHGSPHGDLPIYVKNVFAKGAASENGQLKRGDQILSVNGQSLEGCSHEEAVNILINAKGTVTLTVLS